LSALVNLPHQDVLTDWQNLLICLLGKEKIFWGKFPDGEKLKESARRLPKLINLDEATDGSRRLIDRCHRRKKGFPK